MEIGLCVCVCHKYNWNGALHLLYVLLLFATNRVVRCTYYTPITNHYTSKLYVSGRSLSNTSFTHITVTISVSPAFSILWVYPTGISTTSSFSPAALKIFNHFIAVNLPKSNYSRTAYYQELLILSVMPVLTFGYSGFGDINGDLSPFRRFQKFGKGTAIILVHFRR